jgi:Fe2+ transport system protein FeoA
VQVVAVEGDDALAQRLADHGLWRGTLVELVTTAPLGDPMLFRLRGYRLALRREEAARVLVEPALTTP